MEGVYYSLISVKESCKINSVIEHATNFEIIMKYKVFEKKIDNQGETYGTTVNITMLFAQRKLQSGRAMFVF